MEILIRLETVNRDTKVRGWGNELVMDVRARRVLDPNKKSNSYIADDGNSIVREFVVELDDYSDEDIKEYEGGTHELPREHQTHTGKGSRVGRCVQ